MTVLSDKDIRTALADRRLRIEPQPPPEHFAPSAVDLRIGHEFRRWIRPTGGARLTFNLSQVRIPDCGHYVQEVRPDADGLIAIPQDDFLLARTLEVVELPLRSKLAARVEGRSSLARLGLAIHITAPTIHAGFTGPIVLEIKNLGPHELKIEPGKTCVCQLIFETVRSQPQGVLTSDFQHQADVLGARKGIANTGKNHPQRRRR